MKIGIFGALLILMSSVFATAGQTADFDVSMPSEDIQGLAVLTQEQPLDVITPEITVPKNKVSDETFYYIISYSTADIAASQKMLQHQLEIVYYIPDHQYLVHASAKELQELQEKGYVLDATLVRENANRYLLGTYPKETLYYVYAFQEQDVKQIVKQLKDRGYVVVDTNTYVIVVDMSKTENVERALREIVQIEGVEAAEQRPHYEVLNDVTNVVVGTEDIRQRFGLYGAGQIIAIADSGLDTGVLATLHPDIRGRVISLTENVYSPTGTCQGIGPTNDPQGHGTAVTGAAIGNGLQSGSNPSQHSYPLGSYAGAAPEAQLVFQAVGCDQGGVSAQLPLTIYPPAYNLGARVYSKSFGSGVQDGGYYFLDRDNDQYVNTRKNFVLTMAAGNSAQSFTTTNNAKNVVTVGGFIRDQPTTQIYARGPTKDGRYKPDILSAAIGVLGTGITTTYSSVQTLPGCTQLTSNPNYCELAGTSIATPNVAGAAALIREYLMTQRSVNNPSAALVKALILNGGDHVTNGIPNPNYGWGRMNLTQSLVNDVDNNLALWDVTQGLATNGVSQEKIILVRSDQPLRITLTWTDREACPEPTCSGTLRKLVNDLDLVVTDTNGQQYYGNDVSLPYDDQPDRINNVERVEIAVPVIGYYTLQVRGHNVPVGTQDFALVASYQNSNDLMGCITNGPSPGNIVC